MRFIKKGINIALLGMMLSKAYAVVPINYNSPMGDEHWKAGGNPLRCGLSLAIPKYGIAYFEQYATKEPHFILRKWREVQRRLPAQVRAVSPVWKPYGKQYMISRTWIKPGKYGIFLSHYQALQALDYLNQGFRTDFIYRSAEGFPTTVSLSPIRFQKAYERYQKCLGQLFDFNFNDVKKTLVYFGSDDFDIEDNIKPKLRQIAAYVKVDRQIEKIEITGYADNSGRRGYNNAVSELRAKAVAKYLQSHGVPQSRLKVTWVGANNPVARNDTDEGRQKNRRVEVLLRRR